MGCFYSKRQHILSFEESLRYRSNRAKLKKDKSSLLQHSKYNNDNAKIIMQNRLFTKAHLYYTDDYGNNFTHYLCKNNRLHELDFIKNSYRLNIIDLFQSANSDGDTVVLLACKSNDINCLKYVIDIFTMKNFPLNSKELNTLQKSNNLYDKVKLLLDRIKSDKIDISSELFILVVIYKIDLLIEEHLENFKKVARVKKIMSKKINGTTVWELIFNNKNSLSNEILFNNTVPLHVAGLYLEKLIIDLNNKDLIRLFQQNDNIVPQLLLNKSNTDSNKPPLIFQAIKYQKEKFLISIFNSLPHDTLRSFMIVKNSNGENVFMYSTRYNQKFAVRLIRFYNDGILNEPFFFQKNNEMEDFVKISPDFAYSFVEPDVDRILVKFCSKEKLTLTEMITLKFLCNSHEYDENSEKEECTICYNEKSTVVFNRCGHQFGLNCAIDLKKCPLCNDEIVERSFSELFNHKS